MTARRNANDNKKARQRRERREPFAQVTPKTVKRQVGRSTSRETPLHVRAHGLELEDTLREYIRQRIGFKLGKFGLEITRATVRFENLNGETGAPTCECRFKVLLNSANDVTLTAIGVSPRAAFNEGVNRIERAVREELGRRRVLRTRPKRLVA
jgi:ribosome-associated translation inhibitor RaiA